MVCIIIFILILISSIIVELKSISTSKLQAIDIQTYGGTCNSTLTNDDCQALFGAGAVCRDGQCYCDRKRSYVHHNRCGNFIHCIDRWLRFSHLFDLVLFSDLIFPGAHQRHLYACESVEDCGKDAKKNGIDCKLIDENYHVCQCQQGYYFNPIDYTCGKIRLIRFLNSSSVVGCSSSQSMLSLMFIE